MYFSPSRYFTPYRARGGECTDGTEEKEIALNALFLFPCPPFSLFYDLKKKKKKARKGGRGSALEARFHDFLV